jgi:hypothetical protein
MDQRKFFQDELRGFRSNNDAVQHHNYHLNNSKTANEMSVEKTKTIDLIDNRMDFEEEKNETPKERIKTDSYVQKSVKVDKKKKKSYQKITSIFYF